MNDTLARLILEQAASSDRDAAALERVCHAWRRLLVGSYAERAHCDYWQRRFEQSVLGLCDVGETDERAPLARYGGAQMSGPLLIAYRGVTQTRKAALAALQRRRTYEHESACEPSAWRAQMLRHLDEARKRRRL